MDGSDLISIGQLSTRAGVAASAIRFYESLGLVHPAGRTDSNRRRYTRDTLRRIAFIRAAQRVGLSLDDVKVALDSLPTERVPTTDDWQALAERWRPTLERQLETLLHLRDGLGECIGCGCMSLDSCERQNPADGAYRFGHGPRFWKGTSPSDVAGA